MKQKETIANITSKVLQDPQSREILAKQYEPLLYKITRQWDGKLPLDANCIFSAAQEGFVYSMNTYKDGTSQSFKQYAAWCIRNFILTSSNTEGHIVKFSAYNQKKAKEAGNATFIVNSIDESIRDIERYSPIYELAEQSESSIFDKLYEFVETNFTSKETNIFYKTYGLKGLDVEKQTKIAKHYKVSSAAITYINKKIIRKIKDDRELLDILSQLL